MQRINVEIKARSDNPEEIHELLVQQQAEFLGTDKQTDTYFKATKGRLKLREGNIENALIHYYRDNQTGPKRSDVTMYKTANSTELKEVLRPALEVLAVVTKRRSIYFIENVKFHVDEVEELGDFVEIEAIDMDGSIGEEKLYEQCQYYLNLFKIKEEDLVDVSYSDMVLRGQE
ncbi:MAG: CYTH domain-containing protein [Bacteroidetes bacterium]|jgi:predicted adenylyl cyclase CyaB|nr:CYTH domain-containing protein [Bacteroidota bacterium]